VTGFADVLARKLADAARVAAGVGTFVSMAGPLARVNFQGATVDMRCDGWYPPIAGMPVRVETVDGSMRVVGPSRALSPRGTVTESLDGGARARLTVDGIEYVLPVIAPYAPVPTDIVIINWQSGHVFGEEAAAPVTETPGTVSPVREQFTDLTIQPVRSGRFDTSWGNWWGGAEVWASNNNKGIWVFGDRLGALAGATLDRAEFFLPDPIKAAGAAFIGLHTHADIPGGAPNIIELTPLPARAGWIRLPEGWAQFLRDNAGAGIGVTSGAGDNRWPGVGQAGGSQSGWLRFAGSR
jgi:hypothetical protein